MKHICELKNILAKHFDWNKSRLTVLANVLIRGPFNREVRQID
ncbi:MAG TPA: hypothetical protein VGZ69_07370 [Candidatus Rhabdochlamydia sp.]|jgi:hypothetical protein|nr:hypothetical protein [Candidatus Rhabdochlamydia sp.]